MLAAHDAAGSSGEGAGDGGDDDDDDDDGDDDDGDDDAELEDVIELTTDGFTLPDDSHMMLPAGA